MLRARRLLATTFATALLAVGAAAPAGAHGPVVTGGVINVTLVDVLSGNNVAVQVPIGIAVNVCDVNAAVLLAAVVDSGSATCTATTEEIAFAEQHQKHRN